MEKPVIYTQAIHTPAESRNATVAIRETDTASQAVAWSVSYKIAYHNAKPFATHSTAFDDTYTDFSELSDALKDFFEPVKMA
jgi:hypothetical protein